jgi:hypothetical protein
MKDNKYYAIEMHQDDGQTVNIIGHRPRKGKVYFYAQGRVWHKCKVVEKPVFQNDMVICEVKVTRTSFDKGMK